MWGKKKNNFILGLSKSKGWAWAHRDCFEIACRKAFATTSLLDSAQRAGCLNWQIFFTRVRACLQAGLKKRMRQQERQTDEAGVLQHRGEIRGNRGLWEGGKAGGRHVRYFKRRWLKHFGQQRWQQVLCAEASCSGGVVLYNVRWGSQPKALVNL